MPSDAPTRPRAATGGMLDGGRTASAIACLALAAVATRGARTHSIGFRSIAAQAGGPVRRAVLAGLVAVAAASITATLASSQNASAAALFTFAGRVSDAGGKGVAGVSVNAYRGGSDATCCSWVTAVTTNSSGDYTLSLPAATYRIQFLPAATSTYVGRWRSQSGTARRFEEASDVALGSSLAGNDATLETGVVVSGRVRDALSGGGVAGVNVSAYAGGPGATCCTWVTGTSSASDGSYQIRVPAGASLSYRLQFYPPASAGYIGRWWTATGQASIFDAAADVAAAADVSGKDAALASGWKVTGTITSDGRTPIAGASASIYAGGSGAGCCTWITGATVDRDGRYSLVVPAGTYRLQLRGPEGSRYISAWSDGKASFENAEDIVVAGGDVVRDVILEAGVRVTGRLTSDGRTPIAGANASAFAGGAASRCCTWKATGVTDANGVFSFVAPSGTYRVGFRGPNGGAFVQGWWNGASGNLAKDFASAPDVTLTSGTDPRMDALLTPGVRLSGTVADGAGSGVAGVGVGAFNGGSAGCCTWVTGGRTDARGRYEIVLPAGTYRLRFAAPRHSSSSFVSQWWDGGTGASHFDRAQDLTLAGATTTQNATLAAGATIKGRITGGGRGIAGAFVSAFTGGDATCCAWVAGTAADASGRYSLVLPAGTYRLQFSGPRGSAYPARWHGALGAVGRFDLGTDVAAGAGATSVNMELAGGRRISGSVSGAGAPLGGVGVGVFQGGAAAPCCRWVAGTQTAADGRYSVVVPLGTYRVFFAPARGSPLIGEWWTSGEGASGFAQADDVDVTAQDATGKDSALASGRTVSGRVTEAGSGRGSRGVGVSAFSGGAAAVCCTWAAGVATDATGRYTLTVPEGTYRLQFQKPGLPAQWWTSSGGARSFTGAEDVVVAGSVADRDAALIAGQRLHGRVTGPNGRGLARVSVNVFLGGTDSACCTWLAGAGTDGAGRYQITLPAGTYRLQFSPAPGSGIAGRWSGAGGPVAAFAQAADLEVRGDTVRDLALSAGSVIQGRATSGAPPAPQRDVTVVAFSGGAGSVCCTAVAATRTDARGHYSLTLPAGTYRLAFFPRHAAAAFWAAPPAIDFAGGTDIVLGPAPLTRDIHFDTGRGFVGTVTAGGRPLGGVGVALCPGAASVACADGTVVARAATRSNGTYRLVAPPGVYRLTFSPPAGASATQVTSLVTVDAGSGDQVMPTQSLRLGRRISGRVTGPDGAGVPFATVRVVRNLPSVAEGTVATTRTSASGNYAVVVPPGLYKLRFDAPPASGLLDQYFGTDVRATYLNFLRQNRGNGFTRATRVNASASDQTLDLVARPARTISGRVMDGATPVVGVRVLVRGRNDPNVASSRILVTPTIIALAVRTDANGNYSVKVADGRYSIGFDGPLWPWPGPNQPWLYRPGNLLAPHNPSPLDEELVVAGADRTGIDQQRAPSPGCTAVGAITVRFLCVFAGLPGLGPVTVTEQIGSGPAVVISDPLNGARAPGGGLLIGASDLAPGVHVFTATEGGVTRTAQIVVP